MKNILFSAVSYPYFAYARFFGGFVRNAGKRSAV